MQYVGFEEKGGLREYAFTVRELSCEPLAAAGIIAGGGFGYIIARFANSYVVGMRMPDFGPVVISAIVLLAAAVIASVLPAARAARIDVMSALRSE